MDIWFYSRASSKASFEELAKYNGSSSFTKEELTWEKVSQAVNGFARII